eukprot:1575624-Pyramimonas_sp.AAC.1
MPTPTWTSIPARHLRVSGTLHFTSQTPGCSLRERAPWAERPNILRVGVLYWPQVYFCTDELKDFADTLLVMTHDQVVEVPLLARGPKADVEFEGDFDFGLVVNESIAVRKITIRNKGNKATSWRYGDRWRHPQTLQGALSHSSDSSERVTQVTRVKEPPSGAWVMRGTTFLV